MISHGTHRGLIVLVLAFVWSVAWSGEPKEAPIQLEFEISPTPRGPYIVSGMGPEWQPFVSWRPAYAVAIPLVPPIDWLPSPARRTMDNFVGNARSPRLGYVQQPEAGLSEQQKAFLQTTKGLLNNPAASLLMDRPDPNGPQRVLLYALTLEDAKQMARAYFRYSRDDWWRRYSGYLTKKVQESTEKVAPGQKRLSEIDKLIEASQKSLEQFQKTVPYRTESEAHEAIGELDRMVNAAQVEIAGITAKIEAIQGYRRERRQEGRPMSQDSEAKLDAMFVEESIALRGTEARRQMATRLREQANRFIDLKAALTSAAGERKPLVESLEADQKVLAEQQRELEATRQQEPKIPDKVIIYPVKWVDEPPQN